MADMNTVVGNALLSDQDHDARTGIETTAGNTGALRR